jgi:NADH:ubiquinone oxidoreductase subunit 5 (subunit L)/multisubunit Na+/H+ antiporter MnhA subunit
LPGLGNFISELLILASAFKASVLMSCMASLGLIAATMYSLRIVQKVFLGNRYTDRTIPDLNFREKAVMASLVLAIFWLGLFPQPVFNTAKPALLKTLNKHKEITFLNHQNDSGDFRMLFLPPSLPIAIGTSPTREGADFDSKKIWIIYPYWRGSIISPLGEIRKGVEIHRADKLLYEELL